MIGRLPETVDIDGTEYRINADYRNVLLVFQVHQDDDMTDLEKMLATLAIMLEDIEMLPEEKYADAIAAVTNFMDGGERGENDQKEETSENLKPLIDWIQDEKLVFAAINKVAGKEVRSEPFMHWWTFLGYFNEIGECTLSSIIHIRDKRNHSKKLEKHEAEYYRKNKKIIDIKRRLSREEQEELERFNKFMKG